MREDWRWDWRWRCPPLILNHAHSREREREREHGVSAARDKEIYMQPQPSSSSGTHVYTIYTVLWLCPVRRAQPPLIITPSRWQLQPWLPTTHGVQPSPAALRSNPGKNPQLHTSPPLAAGPPARTLYISQIYWYEIIDSASAPSTYLHISTLPPPSHRWTGACLVLGTCDLLVSS